jgi:hypothetical protein
MYIHTLIKTIHMAKFEQGINGPFQGKVGRVVGCSWKGIPYMRAMPKKRSSKPSEKEMTTRKKWALSQQWLQPVLEIVQIGFKGYSSRSEGFVAAKSYLMKYAFEGEGTELRINPALVKISAGNLPLSHNMQATRLAEYQVQFTWDAALPNDEASSYDQVMLLAYDVNHGEICFSLPGELRKKGAAMLELSPPEPGTYHLYAAFVAYDRRRQSDSVYLGSVDV